MENGSTPRPHGHPRGAVDAADELPTAHPTHRDASRLAEQSQEIAVALFGASLRLAWAHGLVTLDPHRAARRISEVIDTVDGVAERARCLADVGAAPVAAHPKELHDRRSVATAVPDPPVPAHGPDPVADLLRRSLLPPRLPDVAGMELASRYRSADEGGIGGDFYDCLGSERDWVLVLGDVRGKGAAAAALASVARHTVRAAALQDRDPGRILDLLNDVLIEHDPMESFCTAVCAHLHVGDAGPTLTVATGGHPAPLLLQADGTLTEVATSGPLIGLWPDSEFAHTTVTLGPGDLLFLYTDGLPDSRCGDDLFGSGRTVGAVRGAAGLDAEAALEHVEAVLASSRFVPNDDVALLALRARPVRSVA